MKHYVGLFVVTTFSIFLVSLSAHADNRRYVWTYEYQTLPRGGAEIENYFTPSSTSREHMEGNTTTELQYEIEIGMTDRFDFGIYQVFVQNPGGPLGYEGYKLRAKYRIGEKNQFVLDPLIYLEYIGKPDFSEHGIEGKLILAKDVGQFNLSVNPIVEAERVAGKWETETEYALGASYQISELLKVGMEARGSEDANYIGPVIAHGRDNLWVALGSAFSVGSVKQGKPEFQLRLLIGLGL